MVTCGAFLASRATAAGLTDRVNVVACGAPLQDSWSAAAAGPVAVHPAPAAVRATRPSAGSETVNAPPEASTRSVSCADGHAARLQPPAWADSDPER